MNKLYLITLLLNFANTTFPLSSYAEEASKTTWNEKMKGLNQTLSQLLSNVSSDERYQNPKNRDVIESQMKELAKLTHDLKSSDPAITIFATHLNDDVNEAYRTFKDGHRDYARGLIRSLTQSCVACHSRNNSGVQYNDIQANNAQDLKTVELGNFYTATRQFDRAVEEYRKVLKMENFSAVNVSEWEDALKQSIIIAVRVKRDPKLTDEILQEALRVKGLPYFIKQYVTQWQTSVKDWKAHPKQLKTEVGLHAEAQLLITQAKKNQKYPADHSSDILFLRASSILFDLLEKAPKGKYVGEALFMQGVCQESISPRTFENLPRMFYEDCIRREPHSKIAQACYASYEEQTYLGFTGSAGTDLPESVKQKLLNLWSIAIPLNQREKMQ